MFMQRLGESYSSIDVMAGKLLQPTNTTDKGDSSKSELSFQDILNSASEKRSQSLKFSKHANARLATRNINLSEDQMERLESGTTKAREKGIRESLVMVDDLAFIVNIKSNTVVTALGDSSDSVFTNIDGAVIG
jgi:flagellar operon protein